MNHTSLPNHTGRPFRYSRHEGPAFRRHKDAIAYCESFNNRVTNTSDIVWVASCERGAYRTRVLLTQRVYDV